MKTFFHLLMLSLTFFVFHQKLVSQFLNENSFKIDASQNSTNYAPPLSNSVTDIVISNDTIWLGTGKGLSRSIDGGKTWKNYFKSAEFGEEDVSAIATRGKEIWVATAHSVKKDDKYLPEGSGIRYSSDGGETWQVFPQPLDNYNVKTLDYNSFSTIRALGITTAINNITYDIAVTKNAVWITSFAGMARKSTDKGKTWEIVIIPPDNLNSISPTDTLKFDMSPSGGTLGLQNNLNHRAFSVLAETDSIIWIGTAGGINKTTDGGKSWKKLSSKNQINAIAGNFVVAIGKLSNGAKNIIWAGTNPTDQSEKRAVCFSEDGGENWKQTLSGEFAHNFAFKENIVYTVSDNGIFRSSDFGVSWLQAGTIYDSKNMQRYAHRKFYSTAVKGDTIWFGGIDGTVWTLDNSTTLFGSTWTVLRASQPLAQQTDSYAYPNPFAPDDEVVRIHYSVKNYFASDVTVRIFDFGMNLVRTVIQRAYRNGRDEFDEIWDGRTDDGRIVTNGVYFYQIVINNNEPIWGKILVIQ